MRNISPKSSFTDCDSTRNKLTNLLLPASLTQLLISLFSTDYYLLSKTMGRLYANKEFYEISDMTEESTIDSASSREESTQTQYTNQSHCSATDIQRFIQILSVLKTVEVRIIY